MRTLTDTDDLPFDPASLARRHQAAGERCPPWSGRWLSITCAPRWQGAPCWSLSIPGSAWSWRLP